MFVDLVDIEIVDEVERVVDNIVDRPKVCSTEEMLDHLIGKSAILDGVEPCCSLLDGACNHLGRSIQFGLRERVLHACS